MIVRWERLRKIGLLYPLLNEMDLIWKFDNPSDPWGSRVRIDWDELGRDVEEAERGCRKGVGSETYTKEFRKAG